MRKEALLAIMAGALIGIIFSFGLWAFSKNINKPKQGNIQQQNTPDPKNKNLVIFDDFEDNQIVWQNEINLTGSSKPDSYLLIVLNRDEDFLVNTSTQGTFKLPITLRKNINLIESYLVEDSRMVESAKLTIVYESDLEVDQSLTKVATYGSITDISENSIQLKEKSGEIAQISINDSTIYKNTSRNSEIKKVDLALGDFILAKGLRDRKNIYNASLIEIISQQSAFANDEDKIVGVVGKLVKKSKSAIEVQHTNQKIEIIQLPKSWNGPDIADIDIDQNILVTGFGLAKFNLKSIYKL